MNRALLKNGLILLALCFCTLLFTGCGAAESSAPHQAAPSAAAAGVYIDSTAENWLQEQFYQVKACGQFEQGEFEELTVSFTAPVFPCPYYPAGCEGEYVPPVSIKLGSYRSWRHEVVHHLLYKNTGDADTWHASDLFGRCG